MQAQKSTDRSTIGELVTDADVKVLNAALAERGIDAAEIVSVSVMPGANLIGNAGDRFRVLYRQ